MSKTKIFSPPGLYHEPAGGGLMPPLRHLAAFCATCMFHFIKFVGLSTTDANFFSVLTPWQYQTRWKQPKLNEKYTPLLHFILSFEGTSHRKL